MGNLDTSLETQIKQTLESENKNIDITSAARRRLEQYSQNHRHNSGGTLSDHDMRLSRRHRSSRKSNNRQSSRRRPHSEHRSRKRRGGGGSRRSRRYREIDVDSYTSYTNSDGFSSDYSSSS